MRVYPSFRYHKTLGEKVIHNEAQHEHLKKNGWHETPAAFQEEKPVEPVSELDKELEALAGSPAEDEPQNEEQAPTEPTEDEIRAELLERGHSKRDLKNKTVDELKAMLAE